MIFSEVPRRAAPLRAAPRRAEPRRAALSDSKHFENKSTEKQTV